MNRDDSWYPPDYTHPDRELPRPDDSDPVIGTCPKCGLELRALMWYACIQRPCPSGLGSKVTL